MRIWVDADACPGEVKRILFRAAERLRVRLTLVANRELWTPRSRHIDCMRVARGFDVADRRIVELVAPEDLVVTADVPLASAVIERGAVALDPRGFLYTEDNIGERLALRNLMDELRSSGMDTGGPAAYGKKDLQAFANQLDRLLTQRLANEEDG